jgi:hypothetical protein
VDILLKKESLEREADLANDDVAALYRLPSLNSKKVDSIIRSKEVEAWAARGRQQLRSTSKKKKQDEQYERRINMQLIKKIISKKFDGRARSLDAKDPRAQDYINFHVETRTADIMCAFKSLKQKYHIQDV